MDSNIITIIQIIVTIIVAFITAFLTNSNERKKQTTVFFKQEGIKLQQEFLVSKIISNMKYDFTGEKTSVMDLLKIKINDLDVKKKIIIYCYEVKYFFISNYIRLN